MDRKGSVGLFSKRAQKLSTGESPSIKSVLGVNSFGAKADLASVPKLHPLPLFQLVPLHL